jgi:integrin beta 1
LRPCVECQAYKSGPYNEEQCRSNCTTFLTEIVDKLENKEDSNVKTCTLVDEKDCTFVFQYEYGDNKELKVVAERKKVCREPPNVLGEYISREIFVS